MIIYPVLGTYAAMQRDNTKGGGYIGRGRTAAEAIKNCLMALDPTIVRLQVPCHCGNCSEKSSTVVIA